MGCTGSKKQTVAATPQKERQEQQLLEGDFQITLERTADSQALGLKVANQVDVLAIEAVNEEGLVPDFIKANANSTEQGEEPGLPESGDRIVAVNGAFGDAEKMMAELNQKVIVLTIQRAKKAAEAPAAAEETTPAAADAEEAAPAEQAAEAKAQEDAAEAATVAASAEEEAPAEEAPTANAIADAAEAPADAAGEIEENVAAEPLAAEPEVATTSDVEPAALNQDADALEAADFEVAELQDVAAADEAAREERLCRMSLC